MVVRQFTVQSAPFMKNMSEQFGLIHASHGKVDVVGLPAFNDNLIWLLQAVAPADPSVARRVAVVDPGDAIPVIDYCRRQGLIPTEILLTHHHADHTGGVSELLEWGQAQYPDQAMRVYGPAIESIAGVTHPLQGAERLSLASGVILTVMSVPGHTRGHLAYLLGSTGIDGMPTAGRIDPPGLFSGDLLFGLGCGRLFEGTAAQMYAALLQVCALPDDTRIYCAHEYTLLNLPFALRVDPDNAVLQARAGEIRRLRQAGNSTLPLTLAVEKATNPFLRADQPVLSAAVCAEETATALEVFARLRAMRDTFKAD